MSNEVEQKILRYYKDHENETPEEWKKSASYFLGPVTFMFFSIFFLSVQNFNLYILMILMIMNVLYSIYNILTWYNQHIYVYSTHIEYHYGLWEEKTKEFWFNTDDITGIKAPNQKGLIEKFLNYSDFYILNKENKAFTLKRISNPDGFMNYITGKVIDFNRNFDENYQVSPKEIIKSKGTYIEDENGELILKNKK